MKRLTILVLVAVLAYSGYWFFSASAQQTAVERWFQDRRAAGWTADYSTLEVHGFPNRLDTTLTAPRLGDPATGIYWESPFLKLYRLTYKPTHLIAMTAHEQTLTTPTGEIGVTTTDLRASLKFDDLANWSPLRLVVVAKGLDLVATSGVELATDSSQLAIEHIEGQTYRAALDAKGVTGVLPGLIDAQDSSKTAIDRVFADLNVTLNAPLNRGAVEVSRPQPEHITINKAELDWNGLTLAAAGQLDVTPSGTPIGKITVKVKNWRGMLAQERQTGRLSDSALKQIEVVLSLISGLSGNPETLDLPFDFANGAVWLGPLKLGSAPSFHIP